MNYAYVGSFTAPDRGGLGSGGISCFAGMAGDTWNAGDAARSWKEIQVMERLNPSFLCFDMEKRHIYAAQGNGCMLAACLNNGSGGILSLRINADGSLGEICDIEVPLGTHGPLNSQPATQPHQVVFDREGKYLAVCDKGLDVIHSYVLEAETGRLLPYRVFSFHVGCCPRHVVFHPEKDLAYLLNEWIGGVFACRYQDGEYTPFQWIRTAPEEYVGPRNIGAEIAGHPSGRFLYASNRGYSSIAVFRIGEDGRLRHEAWCTEKVAKPRFFTLSEDGSLLYCANEGTHDVSVYRIDPENGQLTFLDSVMHASGWPASCFIKRQARYPPATFCVMQKPQAFFCTIRPESARQACLSGHSTANVLL